MNNFLSFSKFILNTFTFFQNLLPKRKRPLEDTIEDSNAKDLPPKKIMKFLNDLPSRCPELDSLVTENVSSVIVHDAKHMVLNHGAVKKQYNNFCEGTPTKTCPVLFGMDDPAPFFQGRYEEFNKISHLLTTKKLVVLIGPEGIGKTELVRYFAANNKDRYSGNLVFIKADSSEQLELSFGELLDDLKLPDKETDVYKFFEGSHALFIIDNAQDQDSVSKFLPANLDDDNVKINIIVTTRREDWGNIPKIELQRLPLENAVKVFEAIVSKENFLKVNQKEWIQLAEVFECNPKGVEAAAKYVEQMLSLDLNEFSVSGYINILHELKSLKMEEQLTDGNCKDTGFHRILKYTIDNII